MRTADGPVAIFSGKPPSASVEGFVYEVPTGGFRETMRRGKPSGKWAMVEQDMPCIRDGFGSEVPGIPLGDPIRRVAIRDLIKQDGLRVYLLTGMIDTATYTAAGRDAIHLGMEATFVREAVEQGWLSDITNQFLGDASSRQE